MPLRVGTFAQHTLLTSFALNIQRQLFDSQVQVGSGKVSQRYSGVARNAARLVDIRNAREQVQNLQQNFALVRNRLELMAFAVDSIQDIMSDFRMRVVGAVSGNAAQITDLAFQAQNLLSQIADIMNTRDGSRYVFAGVRGDAAPVDFNTVVDPAHAPPFGGGSYPSSEDTTRAYYSGGGLASEITVRLDLNLSIAYGVTADELAFEEILRSLKLVATSQMTPTVEKERLVEGARVMELALGRLDVIYNRIAGNQIRIEQFDQKHVLFIKSASDLADEIENVDIAEAITKLHANQIALEGAFAVLARIQDSTLLNFLR